jgi:WD40 repeat protein
MSLWEAYLIEAATQRNAISSAPFVALADACNINRAANAALVAELRDARRDAEFARTANGKSAVFPMVAAATGTQHTQHTDPASSAGAGDAAADQQAGFTRTTLASLLGKVSKSGASPASAAAAASAATPAAAAALQAELDDAQRAVARERDERDRSDAAADVLRRELAAARKQLDDEREQNRMSRQERDVLIRQKDDAVRGAQEILEEKFRLQSKLIALSNVSRQSLASAAPTGLEAFGGPAPAAPAGQSSPAPSGDAVSPPRSGASAPPPAGAPSGGSKVMFGLGAVAFLPSAPHYILENHHAADIPTVAFADGATHIYTGGMDKVVRCVDAMNGNIVASHSTPSAVMCIDSHAGVVMAGCTDASVRVFAATNLKSRFQFTSHSDAVDAAYLAYDAKTAFSASRDSTIRSWDVARERAGFTVRCTSGITDIGVGPTDLIASSHVDGAIRFFDARVGRLAGEAVRFHDSVATSVRFLPDGRGTISLSKDGTLRVCDLRTFAEVQCLRHDSLIVTNKHARVAISSDGAYAAAGSGNGAVMLFDLRNAKPTVLRGAHTGAVLSVAWADSGNRLASVGSDKKLVVWR